MPKMLKRILYTSGSLVLLVIISVVVLTPQLLNPNPAALAFIPLLERGKSWDELYTREDDWFVFIKNFGLDTGDMKARAHMLDVLRLKQQDPLIRDHLLAKYHYFIINDQVSIEEFYHIQDHLDEVGVISFIWCLDLFVEMNILQCSAFLDQGDSGKAMLHYQKLVDYIRNMQEKSELIIFLKSELDICLIKASRLSPYLANTPEKRAWFANAVLPAVVITQSTDIEIWKRSFRKQYALVKQLLELKLKQFSLNSLDQKIVRKELELQYRVHQYSYFDERPPTKLIFHWGYLQLLQKIRGLDQYSLSDTITYTTRTPRELQQQNTMIYKNFEIWRQTKGDGPRIVDFSR